MAEYSFSIYPLFNFNKRKGYLMVIFVFSPLLFNFIHLWHEFLHIRFLYLLCKQTRPKESTLITPFRKKKKKKERTRKQQISKKKNYKKSKFKIIETLSHWVMDPTHFTIGPLRAWILCESLQRLCCNECQLSWLSFSLCQALPRLLSWLGVCKEKLKESFILSAPLTQAKG